MIRSLTPMLLLAAPALADAGLHHHPHGVEYGWIAVCLAGVVFGGVGGLVLARLRGRT